MDYSPPGPSVHGILQAGILEWVAMPSSRGSSCISYVSRWILYHWATREAPEERARKVKLGLLDLPVGLPLWLRGKESARNAGDRGSILGLDWILQSMGPQRVGRNLAHSLSSNMQLLASNLLTWRQCGQIQSPATCPPLARGVYAPHPGARDRRDTQRKTFPRPPPIPVALHFSQEKLPRLTSASLFPL